MFFTNVIQDIDIIVTYNDPSGAIKTSRVKSRDLSASWVWKDPDDVNSDQTLSSKVCGKGHISSPQFLLQLVGMQISVITMASSIDLELHSGSRGFTQM